MKTDSELLSKFTDSRSQRAFRELVDRHIDWVYSVALRQVGGDGHLAKDVCQEVFASLARKAARLVDYTHLNGWLFRATRFAASDIVRGEVRRRERERVVMIDRVPERLEKENLSWEETGELLDDVIDALGEEDRIAITMRFFQEKPYSEIGETLQIGENTARMRVTRAVDKLHGILSQRGITSTATALAAVMGGHALVSAPSGLSTSLTSGLITSGFVGSVGLSSGLKLLLSLSCGAAAVGIGYGLFEKSRVTDLEIELQALREAKSGTSLLANINQNLDTAVPLESQETEDVRQEGAVPFEITHDSVEARWKHAQELHDAGKYEEAFVEYLWLLDVGMVEVRSYVGVRGSYLLKRLSDLSEELPEADVAMRERRDRIEKSIQTIGERQNTEHLDLALWKNLNQYLDESDRSLAVYDEVENEELRRSLRIFLQKDFLEAKRYEDAYQANTPNMAMLHFKMMRDREPPSNIVDPERIEDLKRENREFAINSMTEAIEIVAGAEKWLEATDLAEELLAFDSSPETVAKLQEHLERADGQRVLTALLKENL